MVVGHATLPTSGRMRYAPTPVRRKTNVYLAYVLYVSEHDICLLILFLGLHVQVINQMGHYVVGQGTAVGFDASLRVHAEGRVVQVVQDVESVNGKGDVGFGELAAHSSVPHEVVGVESAVTVAAPAVDGEVGAYLYFPGQLYQGIDAIVEVP